MILEILFLRLLLVCLSLYLILNIALAFDGITLSARLSILIFTISTIIYPLDNWNKSFKSGNFVNQIIYGKHIIVDNFPKRQEYIDDGKKKIKKLSK